MAWANAEPNFFGAKMKPKKLEKVLFYVGIGPLVKVFYWKINGFCPGE